MDELDRLSEAKEGLPEVAATMRELEIFRELLDNPQMDLPDTLRKNLVGLREATEKIDRINTAIVAAYRQWLVEQDRADPELALVLSPTGLGRKLFASVGSLRLR